MTERISPVKLTAPTEIEDHLKQRVLFLCATNSLLSPMAEALLRHIDSRNFEAFSAGEMCQQVHPMSIEVIREIVLEPNSNAKTIETMRGETFDFIITLDEVSAQKTAHLSAIEIVHWKFENPAAVSENPDMQRRAFRSVRDQIAQRLRLFAIVNVRPSITSERTRLVASQSNPVVQTP